MGHADNHPLRCHAGEGRDPWQEWIPASAGMTKKEAMLSCIHGMPTAPPEMHLHQVPSRVTVAPVWRMEWRHPRRE
jgi:hypothetical protein